jgi:hypothetical protein
LIENYKALYQSPTWLVVIKHMKAHIIYCVCGFICATMNNLAVLCKHFSYNNYTVCAPNICYSLIQVGEGQVNTALVSVLEAQICLIKHRDMKAYGGVTAGDQSASRPIRFTPRRTTFRYTLNNLLAQHHSQSGCCRQEWDFLLLQEVKLRFLRYPTPTLVTTPNPEDTFNNILKFTPYNTGTTV